MSSGENSPLSAPEGQPIFAVRVSGRRWLTDHAFELRFERPAGFTFLPGQKVKLIQAGIERPYSLINAFRDPELAVCVRHISRGRLTPVLAQIPMGGILHLTPAFGFFCFQPSPRTAVWIATGTGIAPFVAFARSGIRGFHLLHGVRNTQELYYHDLLAGCARSFIPCLSGPPAPRPLWPQAFAGRVTAYLEDRLPPGDYDFYLCGNGGMLRDAMRIIDRRFSSARVFSETFF